MSASAQAEGQAALAALDRALAAKPKKDGQAFADATEHLCALREILIGEHRKSGGDALDRLNAIISTSLAGHFPLGNIPWPEIEHARGALEALVR